MSKMNRFAQLKKAHQLTQVVRNDYSLQNYYLTKKNKEDVAKMKLKGMAKKWIESDTLQSQGGAAFGITFYIENEAGEEETVFTFSSAAARLYGFLETMMGADVTSRLGKIDFIGYVMVNITMVKLDNTRSTYNFDLETGEVEGLEDSFSAIQESLSLMSGSNNLALNEATPVDETEDVELEEEVVQEKPSTSKTKKAKAVDAEIVN